MSDSMKEKYDKLFERVLCEHKNVYQAQCVEGMSKLFDAIASAKTIFIAGAGREGIAARSFAMRLMHYGKDVHWLWDDTTPGMTKEDLFILINGSGRVGHINYLFDKAKNTPVRIAMITAAPQEPIPAAADLLVNVPAPAYNARTEGIVSFQPMGNLFEQHLFLMFDVLILLLCEKSGLDPHCMESRHRNVE